MRIGKLKVEIKEKYLLLIGMMITGLIALPYLLLGQGSYVEVHDQLDGEVLNYIYQAKYLFTSGEIREFMNGMGKASMLPPAPAGVLLYKIFSPFAAFAIMHFVELAASFLGMYFLCRELDVKKEAAFLCACLFSYLPFYPVYGLSAYGQPLLVLAFLWMMRGKKRIRALLFIVLVAAFSSFSLIGYAFVTMGFLTFVLFLIKREKKQGMGCLIATILLALSYVLLNLDLVSVLTGNGYNTHRSEMVLQALDNPVSKFEELFLEGGAYSKVYSPIIIMISILTLIYVKGRGIKGVTKEGVTKEEVKEEVVKEEVIKEEVKEGITEEENEKKYQGKKAKHREKVAALYILLVIAAILSVLWNCTPFVNIRLALGGPFPYFQADRIYWCFPFAWMLILGLCLDEVIDYKEKEQGSKTTSVNASGLIPNCFLKGVTTSFVMILTFVEFLLIFRDSTLNKNIRLLLLSNYQQVTWESIYMDDVFSQIDECLEKDKASYSVLSLGMYPSIALYHGYICADGYSNNYDVEYKHEFRELMEKQLENNEEARRYYDDWGNRVYLCDAPYGINGFVSKKNEKHYEDPQYDLAKMKEMNIRYLFAAMPVDFDNERNAELYGLEFKAVGVDGFESENSYYKVWIYELIASK